MACQFHALFRIRLCFWIQIIFILASFIIISFFFALFSGIPKTIWLLYGRKRRQNTVECRIVRSKIKQNWMYCYDLWLKHYVYKQTWTHKHTHTQAGGWIFDVVVLYPLEIYIKLILSHNNRRFLPFLSFWWLTLTCGMWHLTRDVFRQLSRSQ